MKYTRNVAINVVIANMIGTGVFTSLGFQVGSIPSWFSIMVLWAVGAIISLFGAFAYAEISTRIPGSGGEYNYLSKIYHPALGFIAGWVSFIVGFSAPIAAVALAIGSYTTNFIQLSESWIATLIILIVGCIHILGIKSGSFFQNVITRLKIVLISALILSPFLMVYFSDFNPSSIVFNPLNNGYNDWDLIFSSEFAISLVFVCFSYSGWNASVYFASKIEDPVRNIPYSLILGTLVVSVVYLLLNTAFLYSVEITQLKGQLDIGNIVLESVFPKYAPMLSLLFGIALIASLSSLMIAGPSVLERMGKDYNFLKMFSKSNKHQAPYIAIISLMIFPIIMLHTASFEWIVKYIGVCLSLFSILVVLGVPILREIDSNGGKLNIYKAPFGNIISYLFSIINLWMIYHLVSSDIWILAGVSITLLSGFILFKIISILDN
ncbi:MAG TPA: amino acid permease [Flavobacteriales bacterium]|nr:amino acid permease [Flavobacteriales bacterium]